MADTALLNFYLDREQVKSSYKILLVSLTLVGSRWLSVRRTKKGKTAGGRPDRWGRVPSIFLRHTLPLYHPPASIVHHPQSLPCAFTLGEQHGSIQISFRSPRPRIRAFIHKKWISFCVRTADGRRVVVAICRIYEKNWTFESMSIYCTNYVRIKCNYDFLYRVFCAIVRYRDLNYSCYAMRVT